MPTRRHGGQNLLRLFRLGALGIGLDDRDNQDDRDHQDDRDDQDDQDDQGHQIVENGESSFRVEIVVNKPQ